MGKYHIRQRVISWNGLPVTKVETIQGELGSGILDINGNEIFEGDKVKDKLGNEFTIALKPIAESYCADLSRDDFANGELEVIGHAG